MGRKKIEIKRIENNTFRNKTFSKRRQGLFKKAEQLAVLCSAEIAVIAFTSKGKLFEFASTCMGNILSKYNNRLNKSEISGLKAEITELRLLLRQLMGKDEVDGLSLPELQRLVVEELREEQQSKYVSIPVSVTFE